MRRLVIAGVLAVPSIAAARPKLLPDGAHGAMMPYKPSQPVPATVNSHVLFLNNCRANNGCFITYSDSDVDSTTDTSNIDQNNQNTTLSALDASVNFDEIVSCVAQIMAPYNIQVTAVDPGTAPHFEVMIAGTASQMGLPLGVLGVADFTCTQEPGQCSAPYIPNALVFDFANDAVSPTFGLNEAFICGVAAQEIAHAWTLDHTITNSDPMTYNNYAATLSYQNMMKCGSDCQNGYGPFGHIEPCTGTGGTATHSCMSTGQPTQDEVTIIKALFGASAPPPTVAITAPANDATEGQGVAFPITATCTAPSGDTVSQIALSIDGVGGQSTATSPATFMAPTTLALGAHTLDVNCTTAKGGTQDATAMVTVVNSCKTDSDCKTAGDICYNMACIAGPSGSGGIGTTCTSNTDCASGECGTNGSTSLCVVPCDTSNDQCPSGFGCLSSGTGNAGVCWFGANGGGGGCCETGSDARGSLLLGLTLGAALMLWKRKDKAAKR